MSNRHIDELLQQCIAAFDSGSTPEECLAAFPSAREELEPLLRQAISLRVAYAASPRAEFRLQAKERFMFAAGREVGAAFAEKPDPEFVQDARQRFIRAAGADMQEALRNVPPPRLPFWSNARRRLLETAQAESLPVRRHAVGGALVMRAGLSAAVVVLAVAIAGMAYMVGFNAQPSANAEYAALERDLHELELQAQAGETISPAAVQNVVDRTSKLAGQLDSQQQSTLVDKLPALIDRQKEVVLAAANDGILVPELQQAQAQLNQTAQVVDELRLAAAQAPTSTAVPATATPQPATQVPSTAKTPEPTPDPNATPEPLEKGQIRVTPLLDVTDNQTWKRVETYNFSFAIPSSWQIAVPTLDARGTAELTSSTIMIVEAGNGIVLTVDANSGNIVVLIGAGPQFALRGNGPDGKVIDIDQDFFEKAGAYSVPLKHLLDTLELSGDLAPPPATATPTNTASPSATTPASTATPSVTPAP